MKNRWVKCIALLLIFCICTAGVSGCGQKIKSEPAGTYMRGYIRVQNFGEDGYFIPEGNNISFNMWVGREEIDSKSSGKGCLIFRWNTKKVGDGPHMDSTYMLLPDFANDSIYLMDPESDEFPPCGMTVTLRIDPQTLDDHSCIDIIMSESYYESDGHYWPAGKTLMEILYVGIYKVEGGFLLKNGWRIDSRQE